MSSKTLRILGTRGVPAAHGGFETFAEHLSLFLVQRGWRVVVYCQEDGVGPAFSDVWRGVERVRIPVRMTGSLGAMWFDWLATIHAAKERNPCLTLGYNTAVFCAVLRARGIFNVINMDGIEWARSKWGPLAKAWFWFNDWAGCWLGNHLVADHPAIADHLATRVNRRKITTIPYGADRVEAASEAPVLALGLQPRRYLTLIARPEPENSILEVVSGFSRRPRGMTLAVLGKFDANNPYHAAVRESASPEVRFLGAIYEQPVVQALRFHSAAYVHGHQVGGTNPSLVEALGAGNPVFAHDNRFNRWVAGDGARYFTGAEAFGLLMDELNASPQMLVPMAEASVQRFLDGLSWPSILFEYERILRGT